MLSPFCPRMEAAVGEATSDDEICSIGSVAAKVGKTGGVETSCPVKLKTCGFETTKTTSAS